MNNIKKMTEFFKKYCSEKLSCEEIEKLRSELTSEENELVETVIKSFRFTTRAGAEMVFAMLIEVCKAPEEKKQEKLQEFVHLCVAASCRPTIVFTAFDALGLEFDTDKMLNSLMGDLFNTLKRKSDDPLAELLKKFKSD